MSRNTPDGPKASASKPKGKGGGPQPPQRDETDSFISEVSEELRRDRMNRAFRRYGPFMAGAVILLVAASAGYEYWRYETRTATRASGGILASAARSDEPAEAFATASKTLTGGPAIVADLAAATAYMQEGKADAALPLYKNVEDAEGVEPLYRQLATLRAIMAQIGAAPADELLNELTPLTQTDAPFAPLALEIEAGLRLEKGDFEGARASLTAAQADPRTSAGQRQRMESLLNSLPPAPDATSREAPEKPAEEASSDD